MRQGVQRLVELPTTAATEKRGRWSEPARAKAWIYGGLGHPTLTTADRAGNLPSTPTNPTAEGKMVAPYSALPDNSFQTAASGPFINAEFFGLSTIDMEPTRIDEEGNTALHLAALAGDVVLVKLLLEKGGDVTATNAKGWTVLRCAQANGHHAVIRALLEHCPGEELVRATADESGNSVLHCAAGVGDADAVVILLKQGADPNRSNRLNQTPLHFAAWRRDLVVTRHLLDADANMDIEDFWGSTAFELAIRSPLNPSNKPALIREFLTSRKLHGHGPSLMKWIWRGNFLAWKIYMTKAARETFSKLRCTKESLMSCSSGSLP